MYTYVYIGLLLFLSLVSGCRFNDRYTAEEIRQQYSGARANVAGNDRSAPLLSVAGSRMEPGTALTLSRVVDITLANNPDLQQAVCRIERARAMKALSDAAFWPMAHVYTEYIQGNAPSAYLFKTIDQRRLPPDMNFNDPGWFENYESGLGVRMNLFNGGRDFLQYQMARQDVNISELDRQTVQNDLKARVIAAFYDVLAARKFIRIAETSVATAAEQLRIIQVQYAGGGALKSDVLTLKVGLARAQENLVESRNRYQLAQAALVHLMGLEPAGKETELNLVDEEYPDLAGGPATFEEALAHALAHRPELEKARKALIKSQMGLDASKAGYLPRVDLVGKYYVDDAHLEYDRDRENWTAAILFNWDLFAGFSTRAGIQQADAAVREMLAVDRKATLSVKLDVKKAFLNLEAARARYEVAAASVENAEESYRLVKEYYRGGAVTITRYLAAELDRNRAKIHSTAAFYDKVKATAELARAMGKLASDEPQNTKKTVRP